jgi:hypothetical protein
MNQKFYLLRGLAIATVLLCFLLTPFGAYAQGIQLRGTVSTAAGEPIAGAMVSETGTSGGSITDADGGFALTVAPQGTISVSYLGYQTQEVAVNGRSQISVVLREDAQALEQLVVIGYGTWR